MSVIATAGHVDHGKSTLVRALTGINPDRLREEQAREMTIDLGFAWMNLPSGEPVGIIDVPGHTDFIDNMLAGVGGIDLALLVIAADEGPMPQTLEHLAILELLNAERAVVALTKCDMVDEEWITLIRADVEQLLRATRLRGAPVIPVSARAKRGLKELVAALADELAQAPPRRDLGKPRLPVDRVFSLQGFGTVVTGTLVDGWLALGDTVEVITQGGQILPSHVRGLQTHKQKLERAQPGSRVAINIAGIGVDQLARGSVVAKPGVIRPSTLLDARVDMLSPLREKGAARVALRHNAEIKVFSGAGMSVAQARLLERNTLEAGESGWVQLQLSTPMAVGAGDRLIIRQPSPSLTLGGGVIVDAHPAQRHRRRGGVVDAAVIARLEALRAGTPRERLTNALGSLGLCSRNEAAARAQLGSDAFEAAWRALLAEGEAAEVNGVLGLNAAWRSAIDAATGILGAFHTKAPLSPGMSKESLRSQLRLAPRVLDALLQHPDGRAALATEGDVLRLTSHRIVFTPAQQKSADALLAQCAAQPWSTPLIKDAKTALGDAVYAALVHQRRLVPLNEDVFLLADTYDKARTEVRAYCETHGSISAAQARDLFNTTRKYALALLEHFDAVGLTKRVGDVRELKGR